MPCPRCLVNKSALHLLGTAGDMLSRTRKLRTDDLMRRAKIASARTIIYEKDYSISNQNVEELLKEQSYIPTEVMMLWFH